MAEASIPVDLFNPGQVFACLGFLEAAETLLGGAEGAFDWRDRSRPEFRLRAAGERSPVVVVLDFLSTATIHSEAPPASPNETTKWDVPTRVLEAGDPFPFPDPDSPQTLPAVLSAKNGGKRLVLDHWGEAEATGRDDVKFWAGAAGYPGCAYLKDAIDLVRNRCVDAAGDPFAFSAPQGSSFRFDWRRDYIPIEVGFSLNPHPNMEPVGYPLVEIFAALGLTNARPRRTDPYDKLDYVYGVVGGAEPAFHDPAIVRASLGAPRLPFPQRTFRMSLGWPGQEGQARAITTVTEETAS